MTADAPYSDAEIKQRRKGTLGLARYDRELVEQMERRWLATYDALQAELQATRDGARAGAVEEAAKACEWVERELWARVVEGCAYSNTYKHGAQACAAKIRALGNKAPGAR